MTAVPENVVGETVVSWCLLWHRTVRPSVAADVLVGPRRLQGPYTVRWVINGTSRDPAGKPIGRV